MSEKIKSGDTFRFVHAHKDLRNCRCCHSHYQKPTGFWCELPLVDKEGNMVEPVGFCEFCDRNNTTWYTPNKPCHKQ